MKVRLAQITHARWGEKGAASLGRLVEVSPLAEKGT
jgi:hypothetical protein